MPTPCVGARAAARKHDREEENREEHTHGIALAAYQLDIVNRREKVIRVAVSLQCKFHNQLAGTGGSATVITALLAGSQGENGVTESRWKSPFSGTRKNGREKNKTGYPFHSGWPNQNEGRLSKGKRTSFSEITDREIGQIEKTVWNIRQEGRQDQLSEDR
jgi:hypothetical protein